ncbi:hypothetical protein M405DRAFT_836435 [Rhizopogon salebrosus TDB-379]|nr:hypothetical protein M405DRAFT_836435 [Rhizopogon salebrosus TDB-379]
MAALIECLPAVTSSDGLGPRKLKIVHYESLANPKLFTPCRKGPSMCIYLSENLPLDTKRPTTEFLSLIEKNYTTPVGGPLDVPHYPFRKRSGNLHLELESQFTFHIIPLEKQKLNRLANARVHIPVYFERGRIYYTTPLVGGNLHLELESQFTSHIIPFDRKRKFNLNRVPNARVYIPGPVAFCNYRCFRKWRKHLHERFLCRTLCIRILPASWNLWYLGKRRNANHCSGGRLSSASSMDLPALDAPWLRWSTCWQLGSNEFVYNYGIPKSRLR